MCFCGGNKLCLCNTCLRTKLVLELIFSEAKCLKPNDIAICIISAAQSSQKF